MPSATLAPMIGWLTRQDALDRDAADPLAPFRADFAIPDGMIYLDGNSLGALPRATAGHVAGVVAREWGDDLITSWNRHDWIGMPQRIGARIAPLIGAAGEEVIACDSTSINLFKLIAAARVARPGRSVILIEDDGFPTDRYMAGAVGTLAGGTTIRAVPRDAIGSALADDVALLVLSHVDYRSGHRLDMAVVTAAAHAHGAWVLWDLSHSAGAVAVDLNGANADFAVGCGYKYLNGGPGAPAYLFVRRDLQEGLAPVLPGWMGHARPFAFDQDYAPASGITRFLCGTPPVLAMAALEAGLATFDGVALPALFAKAGALGDLYIQLMEARCGSLGFRLASPRSIDARGSHVCFAHPHAYPICRALIDRGVIGDFRTPDLLRMGFAPLYTRFSDVWDAVDTLAAIMMDGTWADARYQTREAVT